MKLSEYFQVTKGVGVLATADAKGIVNAAIYARPHFPNQDDKETVAFIMAERLSYANVQSNPHAAYLFVEQGEGYVGKRLALTKVEEVTDPEQIQAVKRKNLPPECEEFETPHLVYFHVDGVRPLVGNA